MNKLLIATLCALAAHLTAAPADAQLVQVNIAPPTLRVETPPPPPSPGHVWVAGFWAWNGAQYVWSPGHWEQPPQPAAVWERPRWERRGRAWGFTPGRWVGRGGGRGVIAPQTVYVAPGVPTAVPVPMGPPGWHGRGRGGGHGRGRH